MPQVRMVEERGLFWFEIIWRQVNGATTGTLASPVGGFIMRDIKYIPQISFNLRTWSDGSAIDTFKQMVTLWTMRMEQLRSLRDMLDPFVKVIRTRLLFLDA